MIRNKPFKRHACEIRVGGDVFIADASGALFHEAERTLVIADLHLEKGSSFARRGMLLPPYDTTATLAALTATLSRFAPRRVISLGDGFHDGEGAGRLSVACRAALRSLQLGRDWVWIAGNHDPRAPAGLPGDHALCCTVGNVAARHEPRQGALGAEGEIAGHLHPVAQIAARAGSVRRRCFATDTRRCVLPAFGAYAGGLDLRDKAFAHLFDFARLQAVVIGSARVHVFEAAAFGARPSTQRAWRG
ncbi:MAG: ligase-associated DNA damage response endonuclease PdeM [Hyphomicrobiales bacterium]|nr:ligase-associated DNA damage response endonuclease PdeM [Hyphomicrobiales bacterium]